MATKHKRATMTARQLAEDYLAHQITRDVTRTSTRHHLNQLLALFGGWQARRVGAAQMQEFLAAQKARGVMATTAHHRVRLWRTVLSWAVETGRLPASPLVGFRLHRPKARRIDPPTRAAMQLMLLCMCRTGEIRGMRWEEIDWRDNVWRIPIVPLSRQAVAILAGLYALTGKAGGGLVFPSYCRDRQDSPMGKNSINNALRAMGYNARELVGHGFRSVASTLLNEQGWAPDVIETQLAHAPADSVRAAYNRAAWLDDRRRMLQAWADYLDQLKAQAGRP